MTVHIYSDFAFGNDAWDGSQATSGGGSVGPKKHLDRAVGPAWPMKPLLKYQTTISTAAPKGSYAAVGLEHDSSLMILKSIPDETTGGPDIPAAAELQILNTTLAKSAAYCADDAVAARRCESGAFQRRGYQSGTSGDTIPISAASVVGIAPLGGRAGDHQRDGRRGRQGVVEIASWKPGTRIARRATCPRFFVALSPVSRASASLVEERSQR